MYDFQGIITVVVILAALIYAGLTFYRKTRAFSKKSGCDSDCGCNGKTEKYPHNQI